MKLILTINVEPLTLNRMFGGKISKSSGYKAKYYSEILRGLIAAKIIEARAIVETRKTVKTKLQRIKAAEVSANAEWFDKGRNMKPTPEKPEGEFKISARFVRLLEPLFVRPHITWILHFDQKRRRDRKNLIGGLKWLEDCLVDMRILTDDSVEDFTGEAYQIIIDRAKPSFVQVAIEENRLDPATESR